MKILCSFAKTLRGLVTILQSECETEINWLHNNKMIVNPDKIQVILLDKSRSDNTNIEIEIGNEKISSTSSAKLLGVHIHKTVKWKPVKFTDITKIVIMCKRERGFSQQFYIFKTLIIGMDALT